jgi:hypothetical protein
MKRKINIMISIAVIVAIAIINIKLNETGITSDLTVKSLEAFTDNESGESWIDVTPNKCETKTDIAWITGDGYRIDSSCSRNDVDLTCVIGWTVYNNNEQINNVILCTMSCEYIETYID